MTEKEKAGWLCLKFSTYNWTNENGNKLDEEATKRHAITCVDEILDIIRYHGTDIGKHSLLYWLNVREEINIL